MDKNKHGKPSFTNRKYMLYMTENIGEVIYLYADHVVVLNMSVRVLSRCVGTPTTYAFEPTCVVTD